MHMGFPKAQRSEKPDGDILLKWKEACLPLTEVGFLSVHHGSKALWHDLHRIVAKHYEAEQWGISSGVVPFAFAHRGDNQPQKFESGWGLSRTDWGGWVSLSATISHLQLTKRQGEGHRNPLNFVWAGLSSIPVVNDPMDALNAAFLAVEISRHWRTLGEHAGSNDDTIKSPWQLIPSLWDLFPLIVLPDPAWMHVLFLLVLYLVMGALPLIGRVGQYMCKPLESAGDYIGQILVVRAVLNIDHDYCQDEIYRCLHDRALEGGSMHGAKMEKDVDEAFNWFSPDVTYEKGIVRKRADGEYAKGQFTV